MNKNISWALALCCVTVATTGCKDDKEEDLIPQSSVPGLYINEVCSSGTDWVEIYNSSDKEISLDGFHLQDSKGAEEEYTFPDGSKIPAKGFLVLEKGTSFQFGIGGSGDEIKLLDASYAQVDDVIVPELGDADTYSRTTDGGEQWAIVPNGTKGRSNASTPDTPAGESDIDLLINEVMNAPADGQYDFIELYNPTDKEIDLSGLALQDDKGKEEQYIIPSGTKIAPKSVIAFIQNDGTNTNGSFTFGISSKGDKITLVDTQGNIIDTVEVPAAEKGTSYGRTPDGSDSWTVSTTPSAGKSNNPQSSPSLKGIVMINEVYTFSDQSDINDLDYIELYNSSSQAIDLAGMKIWEGGGQAEAWTIPSGKTIPAKGFLVIECDKEKLHNDMTNYPAWGLSKNDETIVLADARFNIIDQIETPNMSTDETYGRKTDGSDNWVIFAQKTKGKSNNGAPEKTTVTNAYGIFVNEVFTNNQDTKTAAWDDTKDFIELYNATDKDFDLGGFSLNDDALKESKRYTFPAGTIIKAKSFLTLDVYKNNTNGPMFGLGKGGDKVFLFDKDGKTVDEVVTPEFADTDILSVGRKTDGGSTIVTFTEVSKNASNNGKKHK